MKGSLTDSELSLVCEAIATGMGLHFPLERWTMLRRNLEHAAGEFEYDDINQFIQWLLSATLNKEQMEILAVHLTISETYFWREPKVFTVLTDFILPELIRSKKKGEKSIRIWSAGCSSGEEPYSIAIALHKTIKKIEDWNITILATDINAKALVKARSGIYNSWSFRNSPSWLKNTYFHHKQDRKYEIIPEIKEMVTFSGHNLAEENCLSALGNTRVLDIIFCRNVLMYFTNEWARKISQNLFRSLSEEGWLIVSSCELSSELFSKLSPVNYPGAILYRKTRKQPAHSFTIHSIETPIPFSDITSAKSDLQLSSSVSLVKEDIQPPSTFLNPLQPSSFEALAKEDLQLTSTLFTYLQQQHTREKTPEATYTDKISAIRLLANKGHLAEALSACNEAIASYKLAPGLYFLRASILQELDKINEAIKTLKQAIYIDPDYIMGHFTLGNLFFRQGNVKNAKRYFNNALELLNTISNNDILAESEGLTAKYIREIILTNLQTQKPI